MTTREASGPHFLLPRTREAFLRAHRNKDLVSFLCLNTCQHVAFSLPVARYEKSKYRCYCASKRSRLPVSFSSLSPTACHFYVRIVTRRALSVFFLCMRHSSPPLGRRRAHQDFFPRPQRRAASRGDSRLRHCVI